MWLDITEYWTLWIILYGGLASLLGVRGLCESCVRNVTRSARPNAEVLLPCAFPASPLGWAPDGHDVKVLWTQSSRGTLLEITQTGRINFSDPREGRVKVFPNLCRLGNFSIRIERLQQSDLGEYCCVLHNGSVCSVVEFSTDNAGGQNEVAHFTLGTWLVIGGGGGIGGVFFVLLIICFCCVKNRKQDNFAPDHTSTSNHEGSDSGEIVYENDEHDPTSVACVVIQHQEEIASSSSTKQQPLAGKPFYANQQEISKRLEKMEKRKKSQTNQQEISEHLEKMEKREKRQTNQQEISEHLEKMETRKRKKSQPNQQEISEHLEKMEKRKKSHTYQQEVSEHLEKMEKKKRKKSQRLQYENPIYANSTQELDRI